MTMLKSNFKDRTPCPGSWFRSLFIACLMLWLGSPQDLKAQPSVARKWNEVLLQAIRSDFARPTVHARNLFHVSAAMYDAWAAYDAQHEPYLLGNINHGFYVPFEGIELPADVQAAREEALSFAAYRLILHRFGGSPGAFATRRRCDSLMQALGYDFTNLSTQYRPHDPAALGNYLAQSYIDYGLQDGANERNRYTNLFYQPVNPPLVPADPGNPALPYPNRWQPLALEVFVDQSGNPVDDGGLPFLSPEWGYVLPFALQPEDRTWHERDGQAFPVWHDPGPPPAIGPDGYLPAEYQWGFALVAWWAAHLDPGDGVIWDISPGATGNVPLDQLPRDFPDYRTYYDALQGGDPGQGHRLNPATGQPYEPNLVPRGDYTRVLAEFWADGPDSETPPGHWFTLLNYVTDHPATTRRFQGSGAPLDPLAWDVKAYFTLGGAMHDAAISAWSIKGYYDYLRPISALRWMAEQGQSSDPALPNYDLRGLPLVPGYMELVLPGDPLVGPNDEHLHKIKLYSWRGPDFIKNPATEKAGVGWILAENWWPYQRPSFVTPPFAGYISGHSTFSRAAAEVLTLLTGDPYFPGGMGTFLAKKNEFLVFEVGPSVDVLLQWATYRDASDQTSLSRIWGGIHPPADDLPGRLIGEKVAQGAFERALQHFEGRVADNEPTESSFAFPNPLPAGAPLSVLLPGPQTAVTVSLLDLQGRKVWRKEETDPAGFSSLRLQPPVLSAGYYTLRVQGESVNLTQPLRME